MVWGTLLGAGMTALGVGGSMAAADKAAAGAKYAADANYAMYNQSRQDLAPYRAVGGQALNAYAQTMGLPGYDAAMQPAASYQLLSGIRTTDKSGNRNVYADPYTGDLYKMDAYGNYTNIGSMLAGTGKNGSIDGIETTNNNRVSYSPSAGKFHSRGELIGDFAIQERPAPSPPAGGGESNPYGAYMESPGYQWRLNQGLQAIDRNAAARGRYMSGAREKAANRYAQDYATGDFQNYLNNMGNLAGVGQVATNTGVYAGGNFANSYGNAMQNAGNARASGYMGAVNTLTNAYNNWQAAQPFHQMNPNSPTRRGYSDYEPGYS